MRRSAKLNIPAEIDPKARLFAEVTTRLLRSIMPDTELRIDADRTTLPPYSCFVVFHRSRRNDIQFSHMFHIAEFDCTNMPVAFIYDYAAHYLRKQFREALEERLIRPDLYDFAIRCLTAFRI